MPIENPDQNPPRLPNGSQQPHEEWQQLARDAEQQWDLEHPGVAALYENHVVPRLQGDSGDQPSPTSEDRAGGRFLHKHGNVDPKEVEHVVGYLRSNGEKVADKAGDRTAHYLNFMADTVNDGILTGDPESVRRQIDAHVIKAGDVPESYFALQQRIAREQGHGDIHITDEIRQEAQRIISADQRHSLGEWATYLSESTDYPDWFKEYTFSALLKMGKFNKEKEEFQRRDSTTTAPFPELSRGALSQVYSWLKESKIDGIDISGVFEDQAHEAKLQTALKNGNFAGLYVQAIHKTQEGIITPEQKKQTLGAWKKYDQNSDPKKIHGDLQGFGLDWCTATGYETAVTHIRGGDFYVYYTRDEGGTDTIPRVAIRLEQGEVAEVRGVLPNQELEPGMADITSERLQDLPGGEQYIKRAADMKHLTTIEGMLRVNPDAVLSKDDILFLYELDHDIQGFGYVRDPRVAELQWWRNGLDLPELTRLLPEVLANQGAASYNAYYEVAEATGAEAISELQFRNLLETQIADWSGSGVMDYLVSDFIENGNKPNLLATPNVVADWQTLRSMASKFGEGQPYETYIYEELYSQYSAQELSGQQTAGALRFSIMPSGDTKQLGYAPVTDQLAALGRMQSDRPSLKARIPSVLDALTFWQTLRARGDSLASGGVFEKTIIRHLNLEPKRLGGWLNVPYSCVAVDGGPYLNGSNAEFVYRARVLVG